MSWALRYGGLGAMLVTVGGLVSGPLQRAALYPAPAAPAGVRLPAGAESIWLATPAGRTELWWLPPLGPENAAPPRSVLLFAHGNGELIDDWGESFAVVRSWGVGVALVEYPGYGRSNGRPSESAIRGVMRAAYDWIRGLPDGESLPVVGYGRSLGGGAVALLLPERSLDAIVLESTFTSVVDLARVRGLPGPLVTERFETLDALRSFGGPALVIHGERDTLIPLGHARKLVSAAAGAELVVLEGCGHNDCPRPWPQLRRFLDRHGLVSPPRSP